MCLRFAITPRVEYFDDKNGWSTGTTQKVKEATVTLEFKSKDGFMTRVEYRGDFTKDPFFVKNLAEPVKTQNALTVGWVYAFSSKTP